MILPDTVPVLAEASADSHRAILNGVAVIAASPKPQAARAFVDLAHSDIGRRSLEA